MPDVIFSFDHPVDLRATPTRVWVDPDHVIHLPVPKRVVSATLTKTEPIDASGASWCWRFELARSLGGKVWFKTVPPSLVPLRFDELPDVDPKTLAPDQEPVAAWWASQDALIGRVAAIEAATGAHPLSYTHVQAVASTVWDINHNLGFRPGGIRVIAADGDIYWPGVEYLSADMVRLTFGTSITGTAYLS